MKQGSKVILVKNFKGLVNLVESVVKTSRAEILPVVGAIGLESTNYLLSIALTRYLKTELKQYRKESCITPPHPHV